MYKLETLERKTVGVDKKPIIRATIKDNQGAVTENVTLWSTFPNFADLKVGDVVEGDLKIVPNGQYVNKTLNPLSPAAKPAGGAFRGQSMASKVAVEEKRQENIEKNMKWKAEGQAYGNSVTNAVNLVIAMGGLSDMSDEQVKQRIVKLRDFLIDESQQYQESDVTDRSQPF